MSKTIFWRGNFENSRWEFPTDIDSVIYPRRSTGVFFRPLQPWDEQYLARTFQIVIFRRTLTSLIGFRNSRSDLTLATLAGLAKIPKSVRHPARKMFLSRYVESSSKSKSDVTLLLCVTQIWPYRLRPSSVHDQIIRRSHVEHLTHQFI